MQISKDGRIESVEWFHRIPLGDGQLTPGVDETPEKIAGIRLPADLMGKTVIDIGAWDGAFSFECERRGAARVLATDDWIWARRGRRGFDLARELLRSNVEDKQIAVEEISPETVGTFDVVLFLGVLYHAQDPMRYLRNIATICREFAIIETHVDALEYPRPAAVFYPFDTLNRDSSNYWGPNPACVEAMLHEVGFARVERVEPQWAPSRMVFHAFK